MPSLRPYPSYRKTDLPWLAQIPAHWDVKRLKNALSRNDGGVWGGDPINNDEGTIVLRSTDVGLGGEWNISDPARRNLSATEFQAGRLMAGDLLVTKSSGSALHLGKTALVTPEIEDLNCCFSNFMQRLRASDNFSPEYIYWIMNSTIGREQLNYFGSTTTGLNNLTGTLMGKLFIAAPPLPEQQAIAAYLDHQTAKIDALIAKKQRLLDLLAEQRAALISQAVTKGLNSDVMMKDSGVTWLGQVPSHWEVKRNGSLFRQRDERGNPDLPLLNVSIHTGVSLRELSTDHVEQIASDWSTYKRACKGDIAFNKMRMWQGAVGVAPIDGLVSSDYTVAIPFNNVVSQYYEYLFRIDKYKIEINKYSHGIVPDRNRLYWDQFKQMLSIYPPFEEQKKITDYLDYQTKRLTALATKVETAIERLREYRAALISSVVTGKAQVKDEG